MNELGIYARYRGRERRRAELVRRSAQALSTLEGAGTFQVHQVEDIAASPSTASGLVDATMALLAAGDWAIGAACGIEAEYKAQRALGARPRAGHVYIDAGGFSSDIQATFALLQFLLSKRTSEGREATSLVRSGLTQIEAAASLGISKQAMSQRLQAAGWQAEQSGYGLAVSLWQRALRQ
ncbi:MarR family transcriptional regulator [Corynebacterium pseudopelargi]|uniref:DNA-binding protein n=1 Tax=Corynebacterium pseudopelargi TaxID=2080757 RepID=A0A3G6IYP7_9CORY|nr:MarR family transcriptional regulator [Corynebacterium pseudopelargi]AZA09250.1 hypothetical protein CPPEL_05650 [Corynebacterium pseudopelargi]